MADSFEQFIASSGDLAQQRGRIAPRNAFMSEFVHKFDLHFAQDFFLNIGGRRHTLQLNADIINLGNLLNRGWGMSPYIQYDNITPHRDLYRPRYGQYGLQLHAPPQHALGLLRHQLSLESSGRCEVHLLIVA